MIAAIDAATYVTELRRIPQGWYAVGAIAVIITVCWLVIGMYRREGRMGASLTMRLVMAGLRCAALLTLALILLEPVRVRILRRWIESYTLILLDTSASMDLVDRYRDPETMSRVQSVMNDPQAQSARRIDVAEKIMRAGERQLLTDLTANNSVKLYAFDDDAKSVATYAVEGENRIPDAEEPAKKPDDSGVRASESGSQLPVQFEATGPATNPIVQFVRPSRRSARRRSPESW